MTLAPDRRIQQPGPALAPRVVSVAGRGRLVELAIQPGIFLDEVARAVHAAGSHSATLAISGGAFASLAYVIPALPPDARHAAYYSEVFQPEGESLLRDGQVTFGTRDGQPFLHCHAFWTEADGSLHGGHILPQETRIAETIHARAWLVDGFGFAQHHDPETNFTLFSPVEMPKTGHGTEVCFGLRLRPNQDLCATLETFCAAIGMTRARIHGGVASIIGADYADGRTVENYATEMFVRAGEITEEGAVIEVALVDFTGRLSEGRLRRGANPVLMTVELVLAAYP